MGITKRKFGETKNGECVSAYLLKNANGMEAEVLDFGAILRVLKVPDKNGAFLDVVHGFDSVEGYEDHNDTYYGATIGRCGNRIAGAQFVLDGKTYALDANDGKNNLHGGFAGYEHRMFTVRDMQDSDTPSICFTLYSPDMDQGFPGNLDFCITYQLTADNTLQLSYEAVSDQKTIINPTNHSYFNLNGHQSGTILDQEVMICADTFTWADAESIPTGELISVEGTPMDFRSFHTIGERIDQEDTALKYGNGYDHNYCVNDTGKMKKIAALKSAESGILMEVESDLPGMQLYTGNFIKGNQTGKGGVCYQRRSGVCFETQYYPDAIHHSAFQQPVFDANETMRSATRYHFSVLS